MQENNYGNFENLNNQGALAILPNPLDDQFAIVDREPSLQIQPPNLIVEAIPPQGINSFKLYIILDKTMQF